MKQNFQDQPDNAFIRENSIIPDLLPISRSTWWAGIRDGRYPQPIKLSPNITAWRVHDIRELLENLGTQEEQS